MKQKKRITWIPVAMLLLLIVFVPCAAQADISDFDITFSVFPELTGELGADVQLLINVENKGATPITWVEVDVLTQAPFHERRTVTIPPGDTRPLSFTVPFWGADVNNEQLLSVSMNNDGDVNSDGVQLRTFRVEGVGPSEIIEVEWSVDTSGSVYVFLVGDTLTVTHTFRNTFEAHSAIGMETRIYLNLDGDNIYISPAVSHGNVHPGETVDSTLIYTLAPSDAGHLQVVHRAEFSMMDRDYILAADSFEVDVYDPTIDVDVHLSASPETIEAGDEVTFTISIQNNGDLPLHEVVACDIEDGPVGTIHDLPAGGTDSIETSARFSESADVRFLVLCRLDTLDVESIETNTVHIMVLEPEESPSPSPVETDAAAAPAAISLGPSAAEETPAVESAGEPEASAEDEIQEPANEAEDNTLLYIIIGVLSLLVLAGAITIPLILIKQKRKNTKKQQEEK